eukprot:CAMPEP_0182458516 /NCGR_PEP_ID=MMETSP1319-20130603/3841_1 /TAXON_ID=172717 /ORGANISM="Bolidomonas pacifica, Strain RCC208" /LENGTH=335 /DNA_ID=CAMNT_0024657219 /DNA_START=182 /DNA_END=1185 /DNA_ORIENTATION=-
MSSVDDLLGELMEGELFSSSSAPIHQPYKSAPPPSLSTSEPVSAAGFVPRPPLSSSSHGSGVHPRVLAHVRPSGGSSSFRKHQPEPEAAQAPSGFRSDGGATMKVAEGSRTWDDWDDDGDNDGGDGGGNTQRSRDSDLDSLLAELGDDGPTQDYHSSSMTSLPDPFNPPAVKLTGTTLTPSTSTSTFSTFSTSSAPLNLPNTGPASLASLAPPAHLPASTSSSTHVGPAPSSSSSTSTSFPPPTTSKRCKVVCLGGPSYSLGLSTGLMSGFVCPRMRCTSCDFIVSRLAGGRWRDDVDYMFFRNNAPDDLKLRRGMEEDGAKVAYCCQCAWAEAG